LDNFAKWADKTDWFPSSGYVSSSNWPSKSPNTEITYEIPQRELFSLDNSWAPSLYDFEIDNPFSMSQTGFGGMAGTSGGLGGSNGVSGGGSYLGSSKGSSGPSNSYWGMFGNESSSWGLSESLGLVNSIVDGFGTGMTKLPGSFRLTKGGKLSFRYYESNWRGGSRARIITRSSIKYGSKLVRISALTNIALGSIKIYEGYERDNRRFDYHTQKAIAELGGSLIIGYVGGNLGAAAGFYFFGGVGAIPGGIIGSAGGAWLGEKAGGALYDFHYYNLYLPR
jgi:hypothetical protein